MVSRDAQETRLQTYVSPMAVTPSHRRPSRVSLEGALVLANVAFLALGGLTLLAGIAVLMLGRAVDRLKDREIADLRVEAATASATAAGQMAAVESRLLTWLGAHSPPAEAPAAPRLAATPPPAAALASPNRFVDARAAPPPPLKPVEILSMPADPGAGAVGGGAQRHLVPAQRQRMESILRLAPSMIMITTDGHAEPERFADELQSVFVEAGWHVDRAVYASLNRPLAPLSANLKPTPIDVAVRGAFAASGLTLAARDSADVNADREIFVGSVTTPK
jgi:hypothetical protein